MRHERLPKLVLLFFIENLLDRKILPKPGGIRIISEFKSCEWYSPVVRKSGIPSEDGRSLRQQVGMKNIGYQ